jgi:hypothetical protein
LNQWRFQAYAKMFEIGVICIVGLAVGYWVTLWLMRRHDDVLHGDFVHPEQGTEAPALPASVIPRKPYLADKPYPAKSSPSKPPFPTPPAGKPDAANPPRSGQVSSAPPRPDRSDTLQSLLASIKRDLKDAAQL